MSGWLITTLWKEPSGTLFVTEFTQQEPGRYFVELFTLWDNCLALVCAVPVDNVTDEEADALS